MNDDLISRRTAIDDIETVNPSMPLSINWVKNWVKTLPSAQPELIERTAYIRGFEQGRTQGMIDAQGGKNMIKAEWTNADTLDLQPTCNQLATDCISRQAAIHALNKYITAFHVERRWRWKDENIKCNVRRRGDNARKGA